MVKSIEIQNFKSHKHTSVDLGRINVFIGTNNSGKSSIFQALQLIKQSTRNNGLLLVPPKPDSRNVERGPNIPIIYNYNDFSIDAGDFKDIVRWNNNELSIGFKAENEVYNETLREKNINTIRLSAKTTYRENTLYQNKGTIAINGLSLPWDIIENTSDSEISLKTDEGAVGTFKTTRSIHSPIRHRSVHIPPDIEQQYSREIFNTFSNAIPDFLNSIFFISGIRGFEERGYHIADSSAAELEYILLEDRSLALSNALALNRALEDKVSDWMEKYLGFRIWFEIRSPGKLIVLHSKRTNKKNPFIGEGLGAQQLFFIFLPVALSNLKTFFIEEPEIHLHPKLQSQLVSHLIDIALRENKQMVFSSHSEHILYAVLSAVNSGKIDKNDARIFYVEKEDNTSVVRHQEIDEFGRLPKGLPGFFENNLEHIESYLKNLMDKV